MSDDKKQVRTKEKYGSLNMKPKIFKKNEVSLVRSSAAEYLTFVAATGNAQSSVEMRYEDENLWLTQKMMATLYDVSVPAVSQHLKRIYADNELEREATVKPYLMVQTEGEREVQRKVDHYSLQAIIAVGFKIENERAVQFRKWANQIVKDYTIQGWVVDASNGLPDGGRNGCKLTRNPRRSSQSRTIALNLGSRQNAWSATRHHSMKEKAEAHASAFLLHARLLRSIHRCHYSYALHSFCRSDGSREARST